MLRGMTAPGRVGRGEYAPLTLPGLVAAFFAGLSGAIPFLALAGSRLDLAVWALLAYSLLDLADSIFAAQTAR